MALGLAYLFGIKLPINFDSPYKATSIIDFWRRWHITLSNFLRDYLYIPLGGNKKPQVISFYKTYPNNVNNRSLAWFFMDFHILGLFTWSPFLID